MWNQPLTLDYQGQHRPTAIRPTKFQGQWDSRRQRRDIPALEMLQGAATGRHPGADPCPRTRRSVSSWRWTPTCRAWGWICRAPDQGGGTRLPLKVTARGRDGSADIRAVLGADIDMQSRLVYGDGVPISAGCGSTSASLGRG